MAQPLDAPQGEDDATGPGRLTEGRLTEGLERGLSASCQLMAVPVVVLVLASLAAFAYGADVFVNAIPKVARHPLPVSANVSYFLVVIDLFLIGATMLISAIGLYELFVRQSDVRSAGPPAPLAGDARSKRPEGPRGRHGRARVCDHLRRGHGRRGDDWG